MNLTGFSLENSRLVALLVLLLAVTGGVLFTNYPSKEDPEVTVREAVVTAFYPGMAPRRVEDLITRKIEKSVRLIPEVEHLKEETSQTGASIVHVKLYDSVFDVKPVWQNLRNKMRDLERQLPEGTIGPFVDDEFGDVFVATVALTADGFSMEEMRRVARELRDEIYTVSGTRKVVVHGIQRERIFLRVSNARLAEFGVSPDTLVETLADQNVILPGGVVEGADHLETFIEPSGNFDSVEDIENLVIRVPATQQVVYLRDLMQVERAFVDPPEAKAYFNGRPALVIAVSMFKHDVNVIEFSPRLKAKVREYEATLPVGYQLDFATYQATNVAKSVASVSTNMYESLAIVLVVVMLFLGWRTGLIVGTVIPLTMLISLVVMRTWGIELQRVSLATMIIALGLLVDNGIVIAEDIRSRLMGGEQRRDACKNAGRSLAVPLLTSSLTTILAFVPLAAAPDSSGEYLSSMTKVISITLLVSWLLGVCATPLMCYWWMEKPSMTPEQAAARFDQPIFQRYRAALEGVLRHRGVFLASVVGMLVAAAFLMGFVPQQFFPMSARSQYIVYLDLPAGYGIKATDERTRAIAEWLNDETENPDVVSHVAYVGYGGPRFFVPLSPRDQGRNVAFLLVNLKEDADVVGAIHRTRSHIIETHPDVFPRAKQFWLGNSETGLVEVRISGSEHESLYAFAERVETALHAIPGTIDVHNNWENRVTKVNVQVDQVRARRAGLTSRDIATSLQAFFSGERVTDYREGDEVIPIQLQGAGAERHDLNRLHTAEVYGSRDGRGVPLVEVADLALVTEFSKTVRRDLRPTVTVSAKHAWLQAAGLEQRLAPALAEIEKDFPPGYRLEFGGETADANKANAALLTFMPHAFLAMFLLMVWQFNSYAKPAIIFITIPFVLIGAVVGLLATGAYFGFMAVLGFLSLGGIVINNAIVLLETIQTEIDSGSSPYDAVVSAAVSRAQPVVMTTLTTILGLLTLMVPPDPLFFAMAIVIASGLAGGTVLTLVAVPVLYTLFFRVEIPSTEPSRPSLRSDAIGAVAASAGR